MVCEDYAVDDAVWDTWSDAKMKAFLVKEGIVDQAKAADYKRHELESLLKANWAKASGNVSNASSKSSAYLSWSDNRLRGWLREHGIAVPTNNNREELLQAMRENCAFLASY